MTAERVARWAEAHPLSPIHVDCATAVMLKILDGKCKMKPTEKLVMALLYEQVKHLPGEKLGADIRQLIADARKRLDEDMQFLLYEKRVLAETMISRPVMKGFKAMLRATGLLEPELDWEEAEAS